MNKYQDPSHFFQSSTSLLDTLVLVELAIVQFSLVAFSYQPSFNPNSRRYVVYELNIRHNLSYFYNYLLDRLLTTKRISYSCN